MRSPNFVPELGKLLLVGRIELELGLGVYQYAGLETATPKHNRRLDVWILIQHAL